MVGGVEDLEVERGGVGEGSLEMKTAIRISVNIGVLNVDLTSCIEFDGLPNAAKGMTPDVGEEAGEGFAERIFAVAMWGVWPSG